MRRKGGASRVSPRRCSRATAALAAAVGVTLAGCGVDEAERAPRLEEVSREIVPSGDDMSIPDVSRDSAADPFFAINASSSDSLPAFESDGLTDVVLPAKTTSDQGSLRAQGLKAAAEGRHQEAIDKLSAALVENNDDMRSRFVLANELAVEGKVHIALVHLKRILDENPKDAEALALRGIIRLQQSKFDEAAEDLQIAIDRPSPSPQALAYAAMAMLQLGRAEEAETLASRSLEKPERFALVAHQVRGLARLRLKRVDAATEDLAAMEEIGPDDEAVNVLRSAVAAARRTSAGSPRP